MKNKIQIFGQRCSGTNYLEQLLLTNFSDVEISHQYGSKHVWNARLQNEIKKHEQVNIIIIVRNPYNWIRSIYKQPHHCPQLLGISFFQFITREWIAYDKAGWNSLDPRIRLDRLNRAPVLEKFENVIDLRNKKNMLFQSIFQDYPDRTIFVNYENIYKNIDHELTRISEKFVLKKREGTFKQYESYKKSDKKFKPKRLSRISNTLKNLIDERLDWKLENKLNYNRSDYSYDTPFNLFLIQFRVAEFLVRNKLLKNNTRQSLAEVRKEDDRRYLKECRRRYFKDDVDETRKHEILTEVLSIKKNEIWALIELSKKLRNNGHFEKAISSLKEILSESPEHKMALYLIGLNFRSIGKNEAALDYFKLCVQYHQNWSAPLKQMLVIYRQTGQLQEVERIKLLLSKISSD